MSGSEQILLNICELIVDCEHKTAPTQKTGYPSIRTPNIGRGRLILEGVNRVSEETYREWSRRAIPQTEDLILAREAPVGNVAIIPQNLKVCLGQRTVLIRPDKHKVCPMFLLYFMLGDEIQGRLLGRSTGATVRHLNMKDIRNLELPRLPTLPTQRKIAAVLSAYDDLIENNTRRIKILEDMAQSIYREWFVNFRFPGHKQVKMVASELGLIPEGWELVKIEQIVKRVPSGKKYSQKTVEQAGSVPVLDQGKSGIIGYHNDAPGVIASEDEPIIVFANHTCYQRMIQFPFSAIQNVLPFLPHSEKHRNIYWLHWATKDLVDFNDYKGHWPEFMSKELSLPPVAICKQFGELIKPMVHLTHSFDRRNQNLRQTRDLLLPKLISGEIDVSDLDIATD